MSQKKSNKKTINKNIGIILTISYTCFAIFGIMIAFKLNTILFPGEGIRLISPSPDFIAWYITSIVISIIYMVLAITLPVYSGITMFKNKNPTKYFVMNIIFGVLGFSYISFLFNAIFHFIYWTKGIDEKK